MMKKTILNPIEKFLALEASSGILLIVAALIALIMANTGLHHLYHDILHFHINLDIGNLKLHGTLHHWVNDALMVVFFFVVGLEIKREMISGELSTPRKAALPLFAAVGGMVVPALFYFFLNQAGVEGAVPGGWGIPMATDIAFAIGVLALIGKGIPFSLRVFLLALAIVDDLGAVFVIAAFYTESISAPALGLAALGVLVVALLRFMNVRAIYLYVLIGAVVWLGFFTSGVHATIAGVVLGFLTPAGALFSGDKLGELIDGSAKETLAKMKYLDGDAATKTMLEYKDRKSIFKLRQVAYEGISPLDRLIDELHPWVSFFIMPLFAFFNAGVTLSPEALGGLFTAPVSMGIILGLVVGKPVGILLFSWLAVLFKMASLPQGVTWIHVLGLGFLGGIGFTMSLFVTGLAIDNPEYTNLAKMGILTASLIASLAGALILKIVIARTPQNQA